jgi:hypothetical protein
MFKTFAVSASLFALALPVAAEPTHVMVRAQALDAKFIGDHMGGVKITLSDARTGRVLAKGVTKGGTGDTARIMKAPHVRGAPLSDAQTAGFDAVLDLDQPTLVRADAEGPLGKPGSSIHVASSLWVIPGRDIAGDGWVLSFPGLAIEPTATPAGPGALRIEAKISLMCGCPIEPDGLWDANTYTIQALLLRAGAVAAKQPLAYAGQPSQFSGTLAGLKPGRYTLRIVATDAKSPNAGVWEQAVVILNPR